MKIIACSTPDSVSNYPISVYYADIISSILQCPGEKLADLLPTIQFTIEDSVFELI